MPRAVRGTTGRRSICGPATPDPTRNGPCRRKEATHHAYPAQDGAQPACRRPALPDPQAAAPSAAAPAFDHAAHAPDRTVTTTADPAYEILVFSRTAGFRHSSIDEGIAALRDLGAAKNFTVTATEDPTAFTTAHLARYRTVVFLSTTGDVLGPTQQTAFEQYLGAGGGYVGIHAAADTEYDWPFYEGLAGALFQSHPAIQPATVKVEDRAHDATAHLGRTWQRTDEWYNYRINPRTTAHVLASLDESSYSGGTMSGDHPIAWCKDYAGGRAFYTGGGHTEESAPTPPSAGICSEESAGPPAPPRPTAARRPATRPVRRHLHDRLEAGGPRRLHPGRRHPHLARRTGPALVQREGVHRRLLAEAGLEAER
ncbi:ThuA domain-containing protein [Streptomyces sp. INA 01156]